MAGIKEKISATVDKLTHKSHTDPNTTGTHGHTTGTGTGLGSSSATGTGAGYDNVSGTTGTGAGYGTTGTGAGYDQTSAGGLGQTTTSTGAGQYGTTGTTGVTGGATTGRGEIIDSETFTKTEDHEVLIEKKRYELEHRPVQKQYVVETKFVGEQQVPGGPTEVVGNEAREVDERIKQAPAGDRTVVVENVDVPAGELRSNTTGVTGSGMTGTGATGTGSTY
jgi:hypothetical protein